jgi:hypothetical protein
MENEMRLKHTRNIKDDTTNERWHGGRVMKKVQRLKGMGW